MSTLLAIVYPSKKAADQAWAELSNREKSYSFELEEVVIAHCRPDGSVRLKQTTNLVKSGLIRGVWWGALIGLLVAGPVGLVVAGAGGAAFGAIVGSVNEYGIEKDFISDLKKKLQPGTSAIFLMLEAQSARELVKDLEDIGGEVLATSLSKEQEKDLQKALAKNDTAE